MDLSSHRPQIAPERIVHAEGYGMSAHADGFLYRPAGADAVREIFELAKASGRQVVLRGAGRSYGDAAIGAECLVLDTSRMSRILSFDPSSGLIECEAGVTLDQIWRHALEDGWWLPVSSGTAHVTVAGAIAMNIHGKNAFRSGTFAEHVFEMDVIWPNGAEHQTLKPSDEHFWHVVGSAGLLGVVTRAVLQLHRVRSGDLRVLPLSIPDLESQFRAFERFEADADYMVSWIDAFARGKALGRGLFHAGWYTEESGDPPSSLMLSHQELRDTMLGFIPKAEIWRLLKPFNNRLGMKLINRAKYKASKVLGHGKPHLQSLVSFMYLLDAVPNWRRAYLPHGFLQYQCFVPQARAMATFGTLLEMQQQARKENFLAVMKRHRPARQLFEYSVDGYSLAMDFKVREKDRQELVAMCHRMNDAVLAAGGRFYFAKDSTLRPEDAARFLDPDCLRLFREIKAEVDPDHLLTSELARRLKLG